MKKLMVYLCQIILDGEEIGRKEDKYEGELDTYKKQRRICRERSRRDGARYKEISLHEPGDGFGITVTYQKGIHSLEIRQLYGYVE